MNLFSHFSHAELVKSCYKAKKMCFLKRTKAVIIQKPAPHAAIARWRQ